MRFATTILSLALLPALAFAQPAGRTPVIDSVQSSASPTPGAPYDFTPLWGTPDGRILAMVALGSTHSGAPELPQSPQIGSAADWQLIDVTNFVTGGLSLRFNDHTATYARFERGIVLRPLNPAAASLECNAAGGLNMAPFSCLGSQQALAKSGSVRIGTDVKAGEFDFDLNYGLSWLHYSDNAQFGDTTPDTAWNLFSSIGDESLPTLVVPGVQPSDMRNFGFNASSHWRLSQDQSLDLGAALSRIRLDLPGTPLSPMLDQAALSFGVHHGDFSGVIVGRVLGSSDPLLGGQHWSTLDLGISWRAPWRGIFSVGAQNLWSSGIPPLTPLNSNAPATDPGMARVPYVQYHQDL